MQPTPPAKKQTTLKFTTIVDRPAQAAMPVNMDPDDDAPKELCSRKKEDVPLFVSNFLKYLSNS